MVIKNDTILKKYPETFFLESAEVYNSIDENHPYGSYGGFSSLVNELNLENVSLPSNIETASYGVWLNSNNEEHRTDYYETKDGYKYWLVEDTPLEEGGVFDFFTQGLVIGIVAIIVFVALTYNYIRIRLRPIQLMKKRLQDLERGDLESKIKIMGTDELAELSASFNKLISEIKDLINQKHGLLLDISHELKSPLTRMLFLVESLPSEEKKTVELKSEIAFLNDMISNLLLTDKLDIPYSKLQIEKIRFASFYEKILGFFNQDQQLKIHLKETGDEVFLKVDLTKMIVCVKNIIQNAFKYADTDKGIAVGIKQDGAFYKITIQDFGPGIQKDDIPLIFDSFFRSKSAKPVSGFGLGLSISKKIIEAHNGKIELNSSLKVGSEFILTLPKEK